MAGEGRRVWYIVLQNFINSLKPRQVFGNKMGKDYIGNEYFEIPANPSEGKRKPRRWYTPPAEKDFSDEVPCEWESWLRGRRDDIPTVEEIDKNLAIMRMKQINGAKLEQQRLIDGGSLPTPATKGRESYPSYPEYNLGPPKD